MPSAMKNKVSRPRPKRQVLLLLGVYYADHHHGIARYAHEAGWVLDNIYAQSGGLIPRWWRGNGMITLITHPKDFEVFRGLPRVPMVDLSRGWVSNVMPPPLRRSGRGRPRVLPDNERIGSLAANHFLERGFKHIALFNFGDWWMETERRPAFRAAIQSAGATYHEIEYHRHFSRAMPNSSSAEHSALGWLMDELRRLPKPLGVFAPTDDLAVLVLRVCLEAGLRVPEEVAVLGCDNGPLICDYAPVRISSVDPDLERQGYEAAQLLDRLMDGQPPPRGPILIPPKGVVTRQSTDILAVPHVPIARALRFIWEHYREPIQIPDIAKAVGISRRGLEYAFRQHLHRSVTEEITRRRVEHARNLLENTDLKAQDVAEQTGFRGLVYFSKVFKKAVGVGPREYRRQHRSA
jgi:LacI family transcriptional regulator